ncbi:helix-turn-helix domain-containing protein [Mycobacterium paraintracellulare]|uniref:helix-turn-helix domain-containing protein n=1 Tax=Mycobacterium paraintracellulare TaxID=1138383 RepID=UPI0019281B09
MPTTRAAEGLTIGQAAKRLGTDVATVRTWVQDHPLFCPATREGRKVRIPARWVEQLRAVAVPN